MLVLTRELNQGIVLSDEDGNFIARVHIARIGKRQVRVGVVAPARIRIDRDEIETIRQPAADSR